MDINKDITDELTPDELQELIMLANEESDKDVVPLEEYKTATERWRTSSDK
ncbi:MAG: hypothetical protein JWQ38_3052 [Flavipsychrobacter sp.]|nr:hypothetical protein [Flavipsychrobacter sp.]